MQYKAEIFDQMQFLSSVTGFNDHQLHCVICFKNNLNAPAMQKAAELLIKAVPILSRIYRNNNGESYWEDASPSKWADLFTIVFTEEDFDRFTFSKTNESTGPQIKICLLQSNRDALSIILNHMVSEAAGFKQCVYLLGPNTRLTMAITNT
jgi:NRPS condensation-like uncharacterized protein